MPVYPHMPPCHVYWCYLCGAWYKQPKNPISCAVSHGPGTCCHYGEVKVSIVEVKVEVET